MKFNLAISNAAEQDLVLASKWYNDQQLGLANEFLLVIDAKLNSIIRNPLQNPIVFQNIRRALPERFPYGIFYIVHENLIVVLAIIHQKRSKKLISKRVRLHK